MDGARDVTRRRNIQHGQKRRHVSKYEMGCLGILAAIALAGFTLMLAPTIGGGA